jgi:hypothetical protein
MSTQPWPVTPALSTNFEPYVDSKQAAVFLAFDWKKVQKLSREGKIPAHPVLSGPRATLHSSQIRKAMNNVYVHGQRQGFLPRTTDGNPIGFVRQSLASDFEPVILTLPQVLDIFDNLGSH